MKSKNEKVLNRLRSHIYPFTHFSDQALEMAEEALRVFCLCNGERIIFPAGTEDDFLFLIKGDVIISDDNGKRRKQVDATEEPYQFDLQAGEISIRTTNSAVICRGNGLMVDDFLALDELARGDISDQLDNAGELLLKLRETQTFRTLPIENAFQALSRMSKVKVAEGEEVVRQYAKGDAYYIINEGKAEVWREELDDDEPVMVAELGYGDAFGEEALVMSGARNATVKMITDGEVLKLGKADFDELISQTMVESVTPAAAKTMIEGGSRILDVRYEEEYEESFIPGSTLIPLPDLRARVAELDAATTYLVLCKMGSRAAAATLLFKQRGFDVKVIEGGIVDWPYETNETFDLELIAFDFCPYAQRALITLLHNEIPHKLTIIEVNDKPDWFGEVSPLGKVPILRINGSENIFESTVINEFTGQLAGGGMLPDDPIKRTTCRSWIEYGGVCQAGLVKMIAAPNAASYEEARLELAANLANVEEQIDPRGPLFLGDKFSLVDSTYAPLFVRLKYLKEFAPVPDMGPRLTRWYDALLAQDAVQQSTDSNFEMIFRHFIIRKGKGGYLGSLVVKS